MNRIYFVVLFCALLGAIAQIFLKQGSKGNLSLLQWANPYIFAGLFLYGVAMVVYLWTLPKGEVSVLYPLIAMSYPFVAILSTILLNEHFTLAKLIGSAGIVLSVWVIAR
jgi:drug/metabolite transporter (DMT)-like permease